jgi:hypothetical protein
MLWAKFSHGFRLDPIAKTPPEALVVLVSDIEMSAEVLTSLAERWATTIPTTAFIVLETAGQSRVSSLDRMTQQLDSLLKQQLRTYGLDASRLVLVGFGYGGTVALHLLLHKGCCCAGIITFASDLALPLPKHFSMNCKLRLICMEDHKGMRNTLSKAVEFLSKQGVDARIALLNSPLLSDESIRHGGSYLVELVATAHRGNQLNNVGKSSTFNSKKGEYHGNA